MSGTNIRQVGTSVLVILVCLCADAEDGAARNAIQYAAAKQIATLANEDILESSGLAISHRSANLFWTHNDSGDAARIFAFDQRGRDIGTCKIAGAKAVDWEDMASFVRDGTNWLLLADVGDNARRRDTCQLYLVKEPRPAAAAATVHAVFQFRYANGPRDCEAVGVDASANKVLLVSKSLVGPTAFELDLPAEPTDATLVAKPLARLALPAVTAMDVSADGRHAVVMNYVEAHVYDRADGESWRVALRRPPRVIKLPHLRQAEAICYGRDSATLYVTGERLPTPLWQFAPALAK